MPKSIRVLLRVVAYAAFAWALSFLAHKPVYVYGDANVATIKLAVNHATERETPCVPLTQEEIAALAANMRRQESCERKRLPLILELDVDGQNFIALEAQPYGLWNDGPASIYERFDLEAGPHRLALRMRDTARTTGWDYVYEDDVVLEKGKYFTITFASGEFELR